MRGNSLFDSSRWLIKMANSLLHGWTVVAGWRRRKRPQVRNIAKVCVYYRICEQGYVKDKAPYMTKEACLANAVRCFAPQKKKVVEWHVLADNVSDATYAMILKYVQPSQVTRVSVGHGAGTFRMVYETAIRQPDDTLVYFLEDDYLHRPDALNVLMEAARASVADYLTLYDHPDKYQWDSPNPGVVNGGEPTRVFFLGNHHWKITNSTTMTFAAFADTLKRDQKCFWRWTATRHPYDFYIFTELAKLSGRTLISPLPSLSTHGDLGTLAPGIDWAQEAQ